MEVLHFLWRLRASVMVDAIKLLIADAVRGLTYVWEVGNKFLVALRVDIAYSRWDYQLKKYKK